MHPIRCKNNATFFQNVNKSIENLVVDKEHKIFIGGDFNVALNSELDCSGGNPSKKDSTKNISDLCSDFDLVDIWRIRNPETKRFTWSRLEDLISENNELITKHKLRELDISPLDAFRLFCVIDALPTEYRRFLKTYNYTGTEPFNLQN